MTTFEENASALVARLDQALNPEKYFPLIVETGCRQHDNGTWIHRRPHTCPKWIRSQQPSRKRARR